MIEINELVKILLVISAICMLVAAGFVVATTHLLLKARDELRRLRRGPLVARDHNGRLIRERI